MSFNKFTRWGIMASLMLIGIGISATALGKKIPMNDELRSKARYYFMKGSISEAEENYDEAYEYYKKAYEIDTTYTDAAFSYGQLRFSLPDTFATDNELDRSLSLIKRHYEAYPKDYKTADAYAYYLSLVEDYEDAAKVYREMLNNNPGQTDLYDKLLRSYLQMDELDSARNLVKEREAMQGEDYETLMSRISIYAYRLDTLALINDIEDFISRHPEEERGYMALASACATFGREDSVTTVLENALAVLPSPSAELQYSLAVRYKEDGDTAKFHELVRKTFDDTYPDLDTQLLCLSSYNRDIYGFEDHTESDKLYEHAIKMYPDNADILDVYASYLSMKGDLEGAYKIKKKILALEPDNADALSSMVAYSLIADKPDEGIKAFESFPNPEETKTFDIMLPYISALQMKEEYNKSLGLIDEVIKSSFPNLSLSDTITEEMIDDMFEMEDLDYGAFYNLEGLYEIAGDIYSKLGLEEDVVRSYENSLALSFGYNPSAQNNYAYYLVETMKVEPGSEEFEKARDMSWQSIQNSDYGAPSTYYDTYAWILFKDHEYKEALECQETAIELAGEEDDYSAELFSHYGDILFMMGRPQEALEQWKKALEYDPSDKLLKKKVANKTFFYE